jgi:hypothetical protein
MRLAVCPQHGRTGFLSVPLGFHRPHSLCTWAPGVEVWMECLVMAREIEKPAHAGVADCRCAGANRGGLLP